MTALIVQEKHLLPQEPSFAHVARVCVRWVGQEVDSAVHTWEAGFRRLHSAARSHPGRRQCRTWALRSAPVAVTLRTHIEVKLKA